MKPISCAALAMLTFLVTFFSSDAIAEDSANERYSEALQFKLKLGHTDGIKDVAISTDKTRLISVGFDNVFKVWSGTNGQLISTHSPLNSRELGAHAVSPNGEFIAYWRNSGAIEVRKPDGQLVRLLKFSEGISSLSISNDGDRLAAVNDFSLWSWDGESEPRQLRRGDGFERAKIALSGNGKCIATGSANGTITVWNFESGRATTRIRQPAESFHGIVVNFDCSLIVSVVRNDVEFDTKLWDATNGKLIHAFDSQYFLSRTTVSLAPDGSKLARSDHNVVEVWDLKKKSKKSWESNHLQSIGRLAFSTDGSLIVSAGEHDYRSEYKDETVKIWDTNTGALIATMATGSLGRWITITPEGFFAASEPGAEMLSVTKGFNAVGIDQVYQALYRPDLVREKLAGDPDGKVREAAAKLDLDAIMASGEAPKVSIISPIPGSESNDEKIVVEIGVADQGGGVGKVEWRVNGTTLGLDERGLSREEAAEDGAGENLRRMLSLIPGNNRIEVVAYNAKDLITSQPASVSVKYKAAKSSVLPKLHVLAVGINDYFDGRLRLNYAVPDAKKLADALKTAGGKLFSQVEVTTVEDADVTAANLEKVFEAQAGAVNARDTFVFFVAGHGKTIDGRYYFLPRDFRYDGEESIVASGIDQDRFQSWFAKIPARRSLLLFDTCESGTLTGERVAQRGIERVVALDKLTRAMGRTVLSASTDDAPALEGYRGHGVFTYALLEALDRGDLNGNDAIEVTELATYVDQKVPEISFEAFNHRQVPQMKIVGSNFIVTGKAAVLADRGDGDAAVPIKASHVVVTAADVFAAAGGEGAAVTRLPPGSLLAIVRTEDGWTLVARDGKALGYVAESSLAPMQ